ncbi:hypothetical protein PHYPSEUDO_013270 [Phytophthora pseudosyringae]|uniref:Regulator of chromosome condensation (RCC1)-like protein n=1 Tax=Phytophthora pseudosyringae TaxID=221518 RepID=A0A8T1W5S2_9STRA|nr:hypothetical protein PHYPSEUDO_013270 [Phytophthora pseudosyringae]
MPRTSPKAASPTAKNKQRSTAKTHATSEPSRLQSVTIVQAQEPRPATPVQRTRKRAVRRPKYHETTSFLERESFKGLAPTDGLPPLGPNTTWFPGTTLGESYRVASTMFEAARQASQETRPVSWGYGSTDGALGHNHTRRVVEMKRLAIFRRAIVRAVSAGNRLSLFLTDDNRVFQSGRLFMKQDGCNMWKPVEMKVEGEERLPSNANVVAVEAGHLAAYALDDQGRMYSWGTQIFGQLGHGEELEQEHTVALPSEDTEGDEGSSDASIEGGNPDGEEVSEEEEDQDGEPPPKAVIVERTPRLVEGLAGHPIVKISAGNHFAVAITSNGAVFSWGRGCFGQLGNGEVADVSTPARVEDLKDFVAIDVAAGTNHVVGVFVPRVSSKQHEENGSPSSHYHEETLATERTVVVVWGRGKHGCLGLGGSSNERLPCENAFFRGLGAVRAAAGADHTLVLCRAGARTFLYAFGGNELGQLGIASSVDHVDMPTFLDEFVNAHVADIGAGAQYSAALTGDGEVFTWGDARYGKTCRADGRTTYVPWSVDLPSSIPSSSFVTQLSVGSYHSLAQLRIYGQVDRWRKFPLGVVAPAMSHVDHNTKVGSVTKGTGSSPWQLGADYSVSVRVPTKVAHARAGSPQDSHPPYQKKKKAGLDQQ